MASASTSAKVDILWNDCIRSIRKRKYITTGWYFIQTPETLNTLITEMWVFGYGSLIWKADFPYEKKIVGYIKGYVRRFYQKSVVHRGIPSKPGRVATLMTSKDPEEVVWGLAYKISNEDIESVAQHLNSRENGYERRTVLFHPSHHIESDSSTSISVPFKVTVYISREDSPLFTGNEDLEMIANHILECHGKSGSNVEYLYKLAESMRIIAPTFFDEHLYTLEEAVKKLEEKQYSG